MSNNETNAGLSLEALLAAAQGAREEESAHVAVPAEGETAVSSDEALTNEGSGEEASSVGSVANEPSSTSEESIEEETPTASAFDLAAALGYGSRTDAPSPAPVKEEPAGEKFDLAAALGYKTSESRASEAAEAPAPADAETQAHAQAQAVQDRALREAQQQARLREQQAAREERRAVRAAEAESARKRDAAARDAGESRRQEHAKDPAASQGATDRNVERRHTARPTTGLGAQSVADSGDKPIEAYQPTKRDRSAQARAARPLKQEEVTEVAQAIAAGNGRTDQATESAVVVEEGIVEIADRMPASAGLPQESSQTRPSIEEPMSVASPGELSAPSEGRTTAPMGEPVILAEEPLPAPTAEAAPPMGEPMVPTPASDPAGAFAAAQQPIQPKPIDFTSAEFASSITAGAPEPATRVASAPSKPATTPHKVPVRTTEEIIKPVDKPVQLGVISPEAARHEAEAKKKVQSNERKIVRKVRRFRALGMLLIVIALAALAGAIFLFVAGNAQASESIEAAATEICEEAGRTITYRYKAADSNGALCPTTEVATFSAGDVLEQSVITMNTPDFETAAHTLANFKKQFQDSAYVDGRVDGSTVIFTLHMSSERIMKVTYTALLMTNTTGCEVILG